MRNMLMFAVLICALSACCHAPVIKQAQEQAEANRILEASITPDLLVYKSLDNGCMTMF